MILKRACSLFIRLIINKGFLVWPQKKWTDYRKRAFYAWVSTYEINSKKKSRRFKSEPRCATVPKNIEVSQHAYHPLAGNSTSDKRRTQWKPLQDQMPQNCMTRDESSNKTRPNTFYAPLSKFTIEYEVTDITVYLEKLRISPLFK